MPFDNNYSADENDDIDEILAEAIMQGNGAPAGGAMPVGPTPAGHQAELNLIYGMVDELSRQLSENRRATEDIVSSLGRLRNRARDRGLSNDDILSEAAEEIFGMCLSVSFSIFATPPPSFYTH